MSSQTKCSISPAMPRQRRSSSTYTAQTLGDKSLRSWKSFSMTPRPPMILPSSTTAYHWGTALSPFRQASMLSRYACLGMPHFSWNHCAMDSLYSGLSVRRVILCCSIVPPQSIILCYYSIFCHPCQASKAVRFQLHYSRKFRKTATFPPMLDFIAVLLYNFLKFHWNGAVL